MSESEGENGGSRDERDIAARRMASVSELPLPADELPELEPGAVIGSYRVKSNLGYGGGLTKGYRVEHTVFGRAATLLHFNFGKHTQERFLHWITLTGNLDHIALLPIVDCGVEAGFPYALLSYVDGRELATILQEGGKHDVLTLLRLYRTVAGCLSYCHEHGIAHRDFKEEHIVVDTKGRPYLKGFYIASRRNGDAIDALSFLETPRNLSSELVEYQESIRKGSWRPSSDDFAASDVFAFGHSLYRAITRHSLVSAEASINDCHERIRSRVPFDVTLLSTRAPEPVLHFVERCLEFEPARRFKNGAELEAALDSIVAHLETVAGDAATPTPTPGKNLLLYLEPLRAGEAGRYLEVRIEAAIGSGAFAEVYRVASVGGAIFPAVLALKVLRPSITEDTLVERFRREAIFLSKVDQENVVRVHGFGRIGPTFFIAMELLEGQSVFHWQKTNARWPISRCLALLRQVASGLEAMHDHGLIHRDLKPENILLVEDGTRAVIADFGIVHGVDATRLTATGQFWGTPIYAAPEQLLGSPPTPATDLYSLGVVFYELLASRRPFADESPHALIRSILSGTPTDIREIVPELTEAVARISMKLIARSPESRFQSSRELLSAVASL